MNFKNRLKHFMEQRHINAAELSRRSGLSEASVNTILRSDNPNPTKSTIEALAKGLDVSPVMFYIDESHYIETMRDFLLPHLSEEEQQFVMQQNSHDFIVLAKKFKASDLSPDTLQKLIDSYINMSKLSK